jgi:hypothetical protein
MLLVRSAKRAPGNAALGVFHHHIYEYKKGLRSLILYTGRSADRLLIEKRLAREGIACLVRQVTPHKINVFFGEPVCIEVLKSFGLKPLTEFTPQEDFMLGVMLGYGRLQQCERYLSRR